MGRLGRLWQTLSIDLPWAISNWFWAQIVTPARGSLRQITLRRVIYIATFLVIAWAAAEFLSADLAIMFAGDTALYIEIASFTYLAIVRGRVDRAVKPAARMMRLTLRRAVIRIAARARRPLRRPRLFDRDDSGDVPDGTPIFSYTFT